MNEVIEELDRRAQAKHNDPSKQLSMTQTEENTVYFVDAVPVLEFKLKVENRSFQGVMVSIEEFDLIS